MNRRYIVIGLVLVLIAVIVALAYDKFDEALATSVFASITAAAGLIFIALGLNA